MAPTTVFAVTLFLIIALIIFVIYAYFLSSTRQPAEGEEHYRSLVQLRLPFFILLLLLLATGLALTLPKAPYPPAGQFPDQVVYVVAKQFNFALSTEPIENEGQFAEKIGEDIRIPANKWVEFRVTSFDVNHGFSLYNEQGRLLGQTQAMPGYVNRLFVKFDKPGRYTSYCMEYCGALHHIMRADFEVISEGGSQ